MVLEGVLLLLYVADRRVGVEGVEAGKAKEGDTRGFRSDMLVDK